MSFHKRPQKHIFEGLGTVYLHTIFRTNCEDVRASASTCSGSRLLQTSLVGARLLIAALNTHVPAVIDAYCRGDGDSSRRLSDATVPQMIYSALCHYTSPGV